MSEQEDNLSTRDFGKLARSSGRKSLGWAAAASAWRRADGDLEEAKRILKKDADSLGRRPITGFAVDFFDADQLSEATGAEWFAAAYALARARGDVDKARLLLAKEGFAEDTEPAGLPKAHAKWERWVKRAEFSRLKPETQAKGSGGGRAGSAKKGGGVGLVIIVLVVGFLWLNAQNAARDQAAFVQDQQQEAYDRQVEEAEAQAALRMPPVAIDDCLQVDSDGGILGVDSCAEGAAPYRVVDIGPGGQRCGDPATSGSIWNGYWSLCLHKNLVPRYCYANLDNDQWITPTDCASPGAFHVIDVVTGGDNDACTDRQQWTASYTFDGGRTTVCGNPR